MFMENGIQPNVELPLANWEYSTIGVREKFCLGGGGGGTEHNLPERNLLVTDAQDDSFMT